MFIYKKNNLQSYEEALRIQGFWYFFSHCTALSKNIHIPFFIFKTFPLNYYKSLQRDLSLMGFIF